MTANKGDWVQIYNVLLEPAERAVQIPEDTKKVPFEMRVNGFAQNDAQIGSIVRVKTLSGRIVEGKLIRIFPNYELSYGKHVPEVSQISGRLRTFFYEGR
jgi:2-amino-4-ketopentanoate thiolase alpha subunit